MPMDPRHITDVHEVCMLSVRLRKRAVPVAWRVRATPGHLGFGVQQELRNRVQAWVPEERALLVAAERL